MTEAGSVQTLIYRLDSTDLYTDDVTPIVGQTDIGSYSLVNEELSIALASRCETIAAARASVGPFLRAWEFEHQVRSMWSSFRFIFAKAEVSGTVADEHAHAPELATLTREPKGDLLVLEWYYPAAPTIQITADMEAVWERFRRSCIGIGEPLQSSGYYALTVFNQAGGGQRNAAKRFNVQPDVLRKLGELTTIRGDLKTARKALEQGPKPLSKLEESWINQAVRYLILQMGLAANNQELEQVTMKDLPAI